MRRTFVRLIVALLWITLLDVVVPAASAQNAPAGNAPALTLDEVVRMTQSGIGEELIITRIRQNGTAFRLSTDQMLQLRRSFVSENVIRVLMDPYAPLGPATASTPGVAGNSVTSQEASLWKQRYDAARSRKKSGKLITFTGLGLTASSLYFLFTWDERTSIYDLRTGAVIGEVTLRNKSKQNAYYAFIVSGLALDTVGSIRWRSASQEVVTLESEGRSKGYITIGPSPQGLGVRVAFNF